MIRSRALAGKRWLIGAGAVALAFAYARSRQHAHERADRLLRGELRALDEAWTTVDDLRAYVRTSISPDDLSTPVVCVHGFGASSDWFVPTLERLAPAFNVYAPDLPGHGRSQGLRRTVRVDEYAEWLVRWMDATQLTAVSLVGSSMGCQIAVELAIRHPERVKRLVLIGAAADRQARGAAPLLGRLILGSAFERARLNAMLTRDYSRLGAAGLRRELRTMLGHPLETRAPFVRQPVLYVRGERDAVAPKRWIEELTALTPLGAAAVVPGWGHAVQYSAADQLAPIIIPFLAAAEAKDAAQRAAECDRVQPLSEEDPSIPPRATAPSRDAIAMR